MGFLSRLFGPTRIPIEENAFCCQYCGHDRITTIDFGCGREDPDQWTGVACASCEALLKTDGGVA